MVTGASTADAILLLVDASRGPTEQTRRHAFVAAKLGIRELIVCVNKMDLVGWSQERFDAISRELQDLLAQTGFDRCHLIPVCATAGDNVVSRSDRLPWAEASLLELLEGLPLPTAPALAPVRLWVQLLLRSGDGVRRYSGQLATGRLRVGDGLRLMPSGAQVRIAELWVAGAGRDEAEAGESVALRFDREVDCARGDLLCAETSPARLASRLDASLVWFSDQPLRIGARLLLRLGTRETLATVSKLLSRTDLDSLASEPCDRLDPNELGNIVLTTLAPLPFDPFEASSATGAFVLIDPQSLQTVGAGMITGEAAAAAAASDSPTASERARRLGHRALCTVLPSESRDGAAGRLERRLFDAGLLTASAPDAGQAAALLAAGLAVVSTARPDGAFETVLLAGSDESGWWLQLEPLITKLREP
jgi:bifunctional enzyme CysN/CysC